MDREALNRCSDKQKQNREDRTSLVTTYHPVFSSMMRVVKNLHPELKFTEEHRTVIPEPPFIASRRCKNHKDILFVVYNMLAVHVLHIELDLIMISHVIVDLTGGGFRGTPG